MFDWLKPQAISQKWRAKWHATNASNAAALGSPSTENDLAEHDII